MKWNLRIPLLILNLGIVSSIFQSFSFLSSNSIIDSILFFAIFIGIYVIFEKTGLNNKKVFFLYGVILILIAVGIDIITK